MSTKPNKTILIVDDTPSNIAVLLGHLTRAGYRVLVAADGASAVEQAAYARPALILLDVRMPGIDGYQTCGKLRADARTADIPVIFMTALDQIEDKVRGFEVGAVDYITKPFQAEEVIARVARHVEFRHVQSELKALNDTLNERVEERTKELNTALDEVKRLQARLHVENQYLRDEIGATSGSGSMIGSSASLEAVRTAVHRVAPTDATVLIQGETGTGKELVARAIHEQSGRCERTLVKVNCTAMAPSLVDSELFGHVRGAFTGAIGRRVGRFELAHNATLFLDEVSELPLETQAKLLRVLQEQEFEPVGSSTSVKVDVRIIAACNRDLEADVATGRFRADLFYRLNVFPIRVPPLRHRRDDIPALAEFFMKRFARKMGKPIVNIDPDTLHRLMAHDWPGNIRDLQNTIERAIVLADSNELTIDWDLGPRAGPVQSGRPSTPKGENGSANERDEPGETALVGHSLREIERLHIIAILKRTRGLVEGPNGAARLLNLKPSTARFRIKRLGIRREEYDGDSAQI